MGVSSFACLKKSVGGRCRERNRKFEKFPHAKSTTRTLWRIRLVKFNDQYLEKYTSDIFRTKFIREPIQCRKYVTAFLYNSINFQFFSNFFYLYRVTVFFYLSDIASTSFKHTLIKTISLCLTRITACLKSVSRVFEINVQLLFGAKTVSKHLSRQLEGRR